MKKTPVESINDRQVKQGVSLTLTDTSFQTTESHQNISVGDGHRMVFIGDCHHIFATNENKNRYEESFLHYIIFKYNLTN